MKDCKNCEIKPSYRYIVRIGSIIIFALGYAFLFQNKEATNNYTNTELLSRSAIILIGLIAGISSCGAMTGGFFLSVINQDESQKLSRFQRFKPSINFNIGRILGFIIGGAILGGLGSLLQFSQTTIAIVSSIVAIIMLYLGISMNGLFNKQLKACGLKPSRIPKHQNINIEAFISGIISFLLPCGFTFAMQIYALQTGSRIEGGIIMLLFALGTIPGLLGLGFINSIFTHKAKTIRKIIVSGFVLIIAIVEGQKAIQLFQSINTTQTTLTTNQEIITMTYDEQGLSPKKILLEKNKNYNITITPKYTIQGCMSTIMLPGLDNHIYLIQKNIPITFTISPKKSGRYEFQCAMYISHGAEILVK